MQMSGGRTRPSEPKELASYVEEACSDLGYLYPSISAGVAYVMWAHWHENDAPQVFRGVGRRIKREVLIERGILPQTVLTHEAWGAMTEAGRAIGPTQAYLRTMGKASNLWLDDYKVRNPTWWLAHKRAQEPAAAV